MHKEFYRDDMKSNKRVFTEQYSIEVQDIRNNKCVLHHNGKISSVLCVLLWVRLKFDRCWGTKGLAERINIES